MPASFISKMIGLLIDVSLSLTNLKHLVEAEHASK